VRYWAAARAAAGCAEDHVSGTTVAEVLAAIRAVHDGNPRFAKVLGISSLLVGDQPLGKRDPADVRLRADDVVEVLPPFAGG
jgi:molybdopterin converting factor small subunit